MYAHFLVTTVGCLLTLATSSDPPTDKKPSDPERYEARIVAAQEIPTPVNKARILIKIATEAAADGRDEIVKKAIGALPKPLELFNSMDADDFGGLLLNLARAGRDAEALEAAKNIDEKYRETVLRKLAESDRSGAIAFLRACESGQADRLEELLKATSKNAKDKDGETGLMKAAANGHVDVVKWLLERQIEVWQTDAKGQTALMKAAANGQDGAVRQILLIYLPEAFHDAYPEDDPANMADGKGMTALMLAADKGHVNVVRTLLEVRFCAACKTDVTTYTRRLKFSSEEGASTPLIDEARKDDDGKTALDHAQTGNHAGVVDLLTNARKKGG